MARPGCKGLPSVSINQTELVKLEYMVRECITTSKFLSTLSTASESSSNLQGIRKKRLLDYWLQSQTLDQRLQQLLNSTVEDTPPPPTHTHTHTPRCSSCSISAEAQLGARTPETTKVNNKHLNNDTFQSPHPLNPEQPLSTRSGHPWDNKDLKPPREQTLNNKPHTERYSEVDQNNALSTSILDLMAKNAIKKVNRTDSLGFYSQLFLFPKPGNPRRPVIDLRSLNQYLKSIRASLRQGGWITSIGL